MILIGDIGGTKVDLALVDKNRWIKQQKFPSRHFQSLDEILEKFLDRPIESACFSIAGPVRNQKCRLTNLSWEVDAASLEKKHRIPQVNLINDLEASAWGLRRLQPQEIVTVNPGLTEAGNQAVIAAGTGLGIAGLYWDGKQHHPFPTEGGHVDFSPRDVQEKQLWDYLHKKYGHVSMERVVSGPGLEHLYWFLAEKGKVKAKLQGEDLPRQIVQDTSPVCQEAVRWFASLYGAAVGNVALQLLTRGGIYLAGGIAPHLVPIFKEGEFLRSFLSKGRFEELLREIPVHVVLNEALPLLGALEFHVSNYK